MPKIFLKMLDTKKKFGIITAKKWTFQIVTNSEYFNTVQKSDKIDSPNTTNITDMQFLISKHIPQNI
jgi:hypothetical protein